MASEIIVALTRSAGCDSDTYTDYIALPQPLYKLLTTFIEKGTITTGGYDRLLAIAELLQVWVDKNVTRQERINVAFSIAQQHGQKATIPNWTYEIDD